MHEDAVYIVAKIVLVRKRLVKAGDVDTAVQKLCEYQEAEAE